MAERVRARTSTMLAMLAAAFAGCGEQAPSQPSEPPGEVRLDTEAEDRSAERAVDQLRDRADEADQAERARREREAARIERRQRARVQPSVPENEFLLDEAR